MRRPPAYRSVVTILQPADCGPACSRAERSMKTVPQLHIASSMQQFTRSPVYHYRLQNVHAAQLGNLQLASLWHNTCKQCTACRTRRRSRRWLHAKVNSVERAPTRELYKQRCAEIRMRNRNVGLFRWYKNKAVVVYVATCVHSPEYQQCNHRLSSFLSISILHLSFQQCVVWTKKCCIRL